MSDSIVKLELDVLLPGAGEADPCFERLRSMLEGREGVRRVHFEKEAPARLCLHFDPALLTVSQVTELARVSGLELEERYRHLSFEVRGVGHERRARIIGERLARLPGVLHAHASASTSHVYVELGPEGSAAAIEKSLREIGVERADGKSDHGHGHGHGHAHGGIFGARSEIIFTALAGLLTAGGWLVSTRWPTANPWIVQGVWCLAYFFGGFYALREAILALRAKRFEIDFLMLVAAAGAAALGEWAEGGLLLFLFSLGHALEGLSLIHI